jgi:prepilin-type processing-associated H-X9-DG protein
LAIISLTPQGFEQTVSAGLAAEHSITTNITYQRLKKFLPRHPSSLFFAEPAALNKEFGNMPPFNVLGAFKAIAAGDEFLPQGERSVVHLEIDFPQLIKASDSLSEGFNQSRGQAEAASCLSNVKQINLALLMFAEDHDEHLPSADHWVDDLMPYTKNTGVFKCPEDKSGARSSYALNSALSGLAMKDIKHPAEVVMIFETNHPGNNPSGGPESVQSRHNNGRYAAYGFVDGHAMMAQKAQDFDPKQ